jgi:hypothetical protein
MQGPSLLAQQPQNEMGFMAPPSPAMLFRWPANTAAEQIVVGASSLDSNAVWTPWPEPCFKRHGEICMAVPTTGPQQFFKLVPGIQFIDDFSEPRQPFTNRSSYPCNWCEPGDKITVTNGSMRIACQGPVVGGLVLWPPSHPVNVSDYYTSVDILSWTTSGNNWSTMSIVTRGRILGPNAGNGYIGGLVLRQATNQVEINLFIWDGGAEVWGPTFNMEEFPPPYRVEFSQVGPNMQLRVLQLPTRAVLGEQALTNTTFTSGWVGLWVNTPENVPESHEIIADNFFVTATKP